MKDKSKLEKIWDIIKDNQVELTEEPKAEVKLMEEMLTDGVTTIEAEEFVEGQAVHVKTEDGQLIPMPIGEFEMQSGFTLVVVEEGIISEIKETAAPETEEPGEEVAMDDKPAETPAAKAIIESVVKETKFSQEDMDAKDSKIKELEDKLAELSKEEEKEEVELKITHNPESGKKPEMKFQIAPNRKMSTSDKVMEKILNLK